MPLGKVRFTGYLLILIWGFGWKKTPNYNQQSRNSQDLLILARGGQPKLDSESHWGKNYKIMGRILMKTAENHPKYRKITEFRSEFLPQAARWSRFGRL
jgi:hypothetical protein